MKKYYPGNTLLLFVLCFTVNAQQTNYPAAGRIGWVNVKDHGAKGDGITDDTKAIQKAITTYPHQYQTRIIVYFPDGIYLVSDTLKYLNGYWDMGVTLQGQSLNGTIIKLKDNSAGYNNPSNPKPLIFTRPGNQAFNMYIFSLTINTGSGNAGAVALDYITSNLGSVKNVNIISGDGQGYCGLRMDRQWPGPGLIKNVSISGYQYGIRMSHSEYSMTFENISLQNQSVYGILNSGNEAVIRKLNSTNSVPVIKNTGQLVLLDGIFNSGNGSNSAIENTGFIYTRNINSSGYQSVIKNGTTVLPGSSITEYCNKSPYTLFPYQGMMSLNLPVKETPEYFNNDTTQWANVIDFGAKPADLNYGNFDATPGIRKAFYSGKAVIYFPPNGSNGSSYHIYDTISIPSSVKLIIGFDFASVAVHNNAALIINNSPDPLIFERIGLGLIKNNSKRTVVLKHLGIGNYDNGPASGDLYVEDLVGKIVPSYPMNLWARQLNTEVQPENEFNVVNQGGNYWILGQKTEGRAVVNKTVNGGYSEILGGLMYPASSFSVSDTTSSPFISINGCISSIMAKSSYVTRGFYPVYAEETQNNVRKVLKTSQVDWGSVLYRGGCSSLSTGIRQIENHNAIVAFPNPFTDNFTVRFNEEGPYTLELFDYTGKRLFIKNLRIGYARYEWNASHTELQNGIYILRISNEAGSYTVKLIKAGSS